MKIIFTFLCGFLAFLGAHAEDGPMIGRPQPPQVLQVWDSRPQAEFNEQILPVIQAEIARCKSCSVHNLTTYDASGQAVPPGTGVVWSSWGTPEALSGQSAVLLINANFRMSAELKPWADYLNRLVDLGTVVVLAAGQPVKGENSAPLSVTLAGKINHGIIIGELGEKDRLLGASFYGPEMFTALHPPRDRIGQGGVPAQFAARLLSVYTKQSNWLQALAAKKSANRKIWMEMSDCFNR